MIISRTPFRVSFFGGGSDYPAWYCKHGGAVLSSSINKYCYLTVRYLPPFFEHRLRLVYSKIENCQHYQDIKHPAVRETLRFLDLDRGLEIHHDGDLPARSGMGSSSSFTVGLLHVLYALKGHMPHRRQLASEAIHIEQNMIGEVVGSQDQISAAYGGLNHIIFDEGGDFRVRPITLPQERLDELGSHLMLFYTGIMRTASEVAGSYVPDLTKKKELLTRMTSMVSEGIDILNSHQCICKFGDLLDQAWMAKKELGDQVSNGTVDALYALAKDNGAIGGKITGAGGGGFLLLFAPPTAQRRLRQALDNLIHVPFAFETSGSQIIFYEPQIEDFSKAERARARQSVKNFRELNGDLPRMSK